MGRIAGAAVRSLLVALLVATPAATVPETAADSSQIVILIALIAAMMTFLEYTARSPCLLGFRDAPPFNRLRFGALFATVFMLSMIVRGHSTPSALSEALTSIGTILGHTIDFPFSPVRLVVLLLPEGAAPQVVDAVRTAAGLSYLVSLLALAAFFVLVRAAHWPARGGSFNVWVNLPLFDPTAGGDVVHRLYRDGRLNIVLGFLLPFAIPAMVKLCSDLVDPVSLQHPQSLIWMMTAWAFLPASMIMRGLAMGKVADMIHDKRRRAYAEAHAVLQHG